MPLGTFIVIEGPDGSGTTKHSTLLSNRLKAEGKDVLLTAEPTSGPIGLFIRDCLNNKTLPSPSAIQLMFCADRAWHVEKVIQPALQEGKIVISDRYYHSTLIYGEALGVDASWLWEINQYFPRPDAVLFALPGYGVCKERMHRRAERDAFETDDFQKKVYELYEKMAEGVPDITKIDTSGSVEDVANTVYSLVKDRI